MAIRSFSDRDTEAFWAGASIARFQAFQAIGMRKLQTLHAAASLADLARIPGNRLEPLKGDRKGQHSIRINDKWRVCFRWEQPDAHQVEITNHYD
jgi:proteic killer suppression protein